MIDHTTNIFKPANEPAFLLSLLPEHINSIQDSSDPDDLIRRAYKAVQPVLGLNCLSLYKIDAQNERLLHLIATKGSIEEIVRTDFKTIEMQEPLFEMDAIASQPIYILDCKVDHRPEGDIVEASALRTLVHCQISVANGVQGTLSAGTYGEEGLVALSEEEVAYFGAIAKSVSLALKHLDSLMLSLLDPLTHVTNRRGLEARFDQLAKLAMRNKTPVSVIYIDINDFKLINDNHGHATGDECLVTFANWLLSSVRESDVVARIGGDEFALVLPGIDMNQAQILLDKLTEDSVHLLDDLSLESVSYSQGIGMFPDHGKTLADILAYADATMYEKKRAHASLR